MVFSKILYVLKGSVEQLQKHHDFIGIEEQMQGMQAKHRQYLMTLLYQKF